MISKDATPVASVGPMPGALREMAIGFWAHPLSVITAAAARCLACACDAFANLLEADPCAEARLGCCFLVSALSSLRGRDDEAPLSNEDEAWLLSEVEIELVEAHARMAERTGPPSAPPSSRASLPVLQARSKSAP